MFSPVVHLAADHAKSLRRIKCPRTVNGSMWLGRVRIAGEIRSDRFTRTQFDRLDFTRRRLKSSAVTFELGR